MPPDPLHPNQKPTQAGILLNYENNIKNLKINEKAIFFVYLKGRVTNRRRDKKRERDVERERERNFPTIGSLCKWPQKPGLHQAKVGAQNSIQMAEPKYSDHLLLLPRNISLKLGWKQKRGGLILAPTYGMLVSQVVTESATSQCQPLHSLYF